MGIVVVVVPLPVVTISGLIGAAGGVVTIPLGAVLLTWVVQMVGSGVPEMSRLRGNSWSWSRVMVESAAVNGPRVDAGVGKETVTPPAGTGFGMGRLKLMLPELMAAGVAPKASTCVVAVPLKAAIPRAAHPSRTCWGTSIEVV